MKGNNVLQLQPLIARIKEIGEAYGKTNTQVWFFSFMCLRYMFLDWGKMEKKMGMKYKIIGLLQMRTNSVKHYEWKYENRCLVVMFSWIKIFICILCYNSIKY